MSVKTGKAAVGRRDWPSRVAATHGCIRLPGEGNMPVSGSRRLMLGAARQAANAAAAAEGNAMGSTNHARIEQSMASLATAMAAMALFEQARPARSCASS